MLCQSCGRPLAPGTQFCGECGAQVGAVATTPGSLTSPSPPPPVGGPEAPTAPQPVAGDAVLPPSPPLADVYGSPPPPPVGASGYGAAGAAPGGPGGSGSKRTVILLSVLGALVVVALLGVGFALARSGGDDEEAAPTTPPTVSIPPLSIPPVTLPPLTVPTTPTTEADSPDTTVAGEPSEATTVDDYCAQVEEFAGLLQDAIDDPFNADLDRITELSSELATTASELLQDATPEEQARITECTQELDSLVLPGG